MSQFWGDSEATQYIQYNINQDVIQAADRILQEKPYLPTDAAINAAKADTLRRTVRSNNMMYVVPADADIQKLYGVGPDARDKIGVAMQEMFYTNVQPEQGTVETEQGVSIDLNAKTGDTLYKQKDNTNQQNTQTNETKQATEQKQSNVGNTQTPEIIGNQTDESVKTYLDKIPNKEKYTINTQTKAVGLLAYFSASTVGSSATPPSSVFLYPNIIGASRFSSLNHSLYIIA